METHKSNHELVESEEEEDSRDEETYRLELVKLIVFGNPNFHPDYNTESPTVRMNRYLSDEEKYSDVMKRMLRDVKSTKIRGFYFKHVNEDQELDQRHMTEALVAKFFSKSTLTEKRTLEGDILSELVGEVFRFLPLCGIEVPQEIISLILSFLELGPSLLFNVGSTCKTLYFQVLCLDWGRFIKITKRNYLGFSLLVMRNASWAELDEYRGTFTEHELEHIFPNFSRLETLEIITDKNVSILKKLEGIFIKRGGKSSFRNVKKLHFTSLSEKSTYRHSYQGYSSHYNKTKFECKTQFTHIPKFFPSLKTVINPPSLQMFHPLPLENVLGDINDSVTQMKEYYPESAKGIVCDSADLIDLVQTRLRNLESFTIEDSQESFTILDKLSFHEDVQLREMKLNVGKGYRNIERFFKRMQPNSSRLEKLEINFPQFLSLFSLDAVFSLFPKVKNFTGNFGERSMEKQEFVSLLVDEILLKRNFESFKITIAMERNLEFVIQNEFVVVKSGIYEMDYWRQDRWNTIPFEDSFQRFLDHVRLRKDVLEKKGIAFHLVVGNRTRTSVWKTFVEKNLWNGVVEGVKDGCEKKMDQLVGGSNVGSRYTATAKDFLVCHMK